MLEGFHPLCRAVEKRQQAHRCSRTGAQGLGNRARQTPVGRAQTPLGYPFSGGSQHWGSRLARPAPGVLGTAAWLVVVRQGNGREPWYLLTNDPVETEKQAWEIVFSYARRWKIEEQFRFQKTELLIASVRLQNWEPRRTLLLLVTLAYGFLLWASAPPRFQARSRLLVQFGQRADWRQWKAKLPLYRFRWALSRLWLAHPPAFSLCQPYRPLSHITWPSCSLRWWMTLWHQTGYLF